MHSPVPVREAPSRGKGEVNGNKFQKKQRGSRGLCPQPWLPPDHPPLAAGGKPQTSKAEATGRPRTRQGREGECEGGRPAGDGMQVDSLAGRRLSSARHRRGQTEREWCLAGCWGGGRDEGRACEAGGKAATKSESWTAAEEVARESLHGQKLREQDGDGAPPAPQWDDAGSRRALGLRGKLGGTAPSQGAPPSLEASS